MLCEAEELELMRRELVLLKAVELRLNQNKIDSYYPEAGPLRRELYRQHMQFFSLGKTVPTRCFMAANRVGKTEGAGGYELVCHLTGEYPPWWDGFRFDRPIRAWCAGDTSETVRDILQLKILGPAENYGTGLIRSSAFAGAPTMRRSGNGSVDHVMVKSKFGGESRLAFKSYDQGRESFQGTEQDVILLDEESNEGIRGECVIRLMTTNGLLIETFTPLRGLTPIVLKYLGPEAQVPSSRVAVVEDRAIVFAGWNDVPHLSEPQKARMLSEAAPHLRKARSTGVPGLGAGAIYPVDEDEIVVEPFEIPRHWKRAYGLDVGWNRTAAIFGAIDPDEDVGYLYSEHYLGQSEPSAHAAAIKARKVERGTIDPASRGRSQKDGAQLLEDYIALGLNLIPADNSRESGLYAVHEKLATGRLKVFSTCKHWLAEYRIYRRDEKGQVVKKDDHLMDATRYFVVTGWNIATAPFSSQPGTWRQKRGR